MRLFPLDDGREVRGNRWDVALPRARTPVDRHHKAITLWDYSTCSGRCCMGTTLFHKVGITHTQIHPGGE